MAKHNNTDLYPFDDNVSLGDGLLGFDIDNYKRTRNYRISDIASLIIQQIGIAYGNSIISGGVVWIADLTYEVTNLWYVIGGTIYSAEDERVILSDADDTYGRIDVIYADVDGNISVLEGVPSADPVRPILDNETQILVSFVLVGANATQPADVSEINIYSDNLVTDWTNSSTPSEFTDFDFTESVNSGTKSISVKSTENSLLLGFTSAIDVDFNTISGLHFYVKLPATTTNTFRISIYFLDSDNNPSSVLSLDTNEFGLDVTNTSTFQSIIIPKSNFTGLTSINRLFFRLQDESVGATIDDIRLFGGVNNPPSFGSFLSLSDTPDDYVNKGNYILTVNASEDGIAFISDIFTAKETDDIGTQIPLDTIGGHNCNLGDANNNESFTITNLGITNAYARILINTANAPSFPSGVNQESGVPFVANTDLYLIVWNKGDEGVSYCYIPLSVNSTSGSSSRTISTTLPASIIINSAIDYHVTNGTIKPALSGHVERADIEVVSHPGDGDNLYIDLTEYPHATLTGGGYTESPANYFTLNSDEVNGFYKQHFTLMLWRRNNLIISNSMQHIPTDNITFVSSVNTNNEYVQITFNKIVNDAELIISNFNKTFTQNGDTATDITLDSITAGDGTAISEDTNSIRIYYSITGSSNGNATFTITASTLTDIYSNVSNNIISDNIALNSSGIEGFANVVEYWKEGVSNNTTGTATMTGVKNSKILSASGFSNPTLASDLWDFNGINQGLQISDSEINDVFNPINKLGQIHYIGQFNNTASSRIVTSTISNSTLNSSDFIYKGGDGNAYFLINGDSGQVSQNLGISLSLNIDYLFSVKFDRRDLGSGIVNVVDCYIDDGTTIQSYLDLDISSANGTLSFDVLSIGMRDRGSVNYYEVGFKSLVIGDSVNNFDSIRNLLAL